MTLFDFNPVHVGFVRNMGPVTVLSYAEDLLKVGVPFGAAHLKTDALKLISKWVQGQGELTTLVVAFEGRVDAKRVEPRSRFLLEEVLDARRISTQWIGVTRYTKSPATHFILESGESLAGLMAQERTRRLRSWGIELSATDSRVGPGGSTDD